jgi:hypothetical protein
VSSDLSLKSLGDIFSISNKRPITVNGANVDADLVTDAPGVVQGGKGSCAHVHVGAMAVTLLVA